MPTILLQDDAETPRRAAQTVAEGGVVAFRTDTFYGLGADPFNASALRAVVRLKGRDEGKPVLVVLGDADAADRLVAARSPLFDALAGEFWPGPLTLVAEARTELPRELTAGTGTVGVRLPADEEVRALVRACGGALTATSANPSGSPPARTAPEAAHYFRESGLLVVDGGATRAELPSTVLDVTGRDARLIREGVITKDRLLRTLEAVGARLLERP